MVWRKRSKRLKSGFIRTIITGQSLRVNHNITMLRQSIQPVQILLR